MNFLKSGSFWISIASAIILVLQAVFGWNVDNELVNEISSAVLGALVIFGFVKKPQTTTNNTDSKVDSTKEDDEKTEETKSDEE